MIAFLHTSSTHVERFTNIVRKYNATIEMEHFIEEKLLETASKTRKIDKLGFASTVRLIQKKRPDLIICTCSTYGEACEDFADVKRIDMPIAEYIVEHFSSVILAYTAVSTRDVSMRLLENVAKIRGKEIQIIDCDCTDSWQYFLSNDLENYNKEIFEKVNEINSKGKAVFLAQASMEGVKRYFGESNSEVFSSGEFGVKEYLKMVKNKSLPD